MKFWALFVVCMFYSTASFAADINKFSYEQLSGDKLAQSTPIKLKSLRGHNTLMVFWRSDCAPCMHEMRILPYIADTYPKLPVVLISLENADTARAHMADMPELVQLWVAKDDGAKVLSAFGDAKKSLPFSVMLDAKGRICYRHDGLIGTQAVEDGLKKCK